MLELPSLDRLARIQSSDYILKQAFAGIFVYVVYLCSDFGFQFVYCGWLVEVHTIFQACPQKKSSGVKSGLPACYVPLDVIRSAKKSVRTSSVILAV